MLCSKNCFCGQGCCCGAPEAKRWDRPLWALSRTLASTFPGTLQKCQEAILKMGCNLRFTGDSSIHCLSNACM